MTTLSSAPLSLRDYARRAATTDRFRGEDGPDHFRNLSFGLYGEVGGLLSALKKVRRDFLLTKETELARIEIGDALWYLVNAARVCGIDPDVLGSTALAELRKRFRETSDHLAAPISFRRIDAICALHGETMAHSREQLLRECGEMVGRAVSVSYEFAMAQLPEARAQMFGEVLAQLARVSESFGLSIEDVAQANLDKVFDRWLEAPKRTDYFMPEPQGEPFEQFPLKFDVHFCERKVGARNVVVQQINGINIGDPLTDNSHKPDGYRFHDVFHLAYAAHLGWSPVMRALMKLKRKSNGKIDENEDGARAIIIEEGIATWIFNDAKRKRMYADIELGRLDYNILTQVRSMVDGFEVGDAPLWQWERAILDGFTVFRQLYAFRGGTVTANLTNHTLTFKKPGLAKAPAASR